MCSFPPPERSFVTMSTKTLFIITGAAAWIGGIATAMTALSCDVEECAGEPAPSVIVRLWKQEGSAQVPVQASSLKYQVHATGGSRHDEFAPNPSPLKSGECLDSMCTTWTVGHDQPGRVAIYAEACGERHEAEAIVELDDLACHAETQYVDIQVDGKLCPVGPERIPPWECDELAHPSVVVMVAKKYDDYYAKVPVDDVWFSHMGETYEARCMENGQGECDLWFAGYDLAGPITVSTEYCDTVVSDSVKVDMEPNSCHVATEYMILEVSTLGCLTDQLPDAKPPRPGIGGPWDYTARTLPDPPPPRGPDDLTDRSRPLPPPRGPDDLTAKPRISPPDNPIDDLKDRNRAIRPGQDGPTDLRNDDLSPPDPRGSLR